LRTLWFEHGDIGLAVRFPRRLPTRLRFALFGLQAITHPLRVQPPLRGDEQLLGLLDPKLPDGCSRKSGGMPRPPPCAGGCRPRCGASAAGYGLRPTPQYESIAAGEPVSGRHSGGETTPGSTSSRPSKKRAMRSGLRRW
jgi:hypothetical protein